MIKLKNLSYRYGERVIFERLNLELASHQLTAVIGRNGSGKTTLAEILNGLKSDFRGEIMLDNLLLKRHIPIAKLRQKIGLVMQNPDFQILFDCVFDEIEFPLQNLNLPQATTHQLEKRHQIIVDSLNAVGLVDHINDNPRELSGGQKQRLNLATTLALRPEYIVLDEATSMLDLPSREQLYKLLLQLKSQHGIILMTNNLDEILLAERIIILDQAQAHSYIKAEIIQNPEILINHGLQPSLMLRLARQFKLSDYFQILTAVGQ